VRPAFSENVLFFPTAAAAELAGFRPCLRCRPEAAPGSPAWHGSAATVSRGLTLIDRGFLDGHGLPDLAAVLGMGSRHLTRLFVQHCGAPPGAIARTRRVQVAKRLLDETTLRVTEIALAAGFSSLRRFNSVFRATYGRSPSEIRRRAAVAIARTDAIALRLYYRPPYDWPAKLRVLSAEAVSGVECVSENEYRRTISLGGVHGWLAVRRARHEHALRVILHLPDYSRLKVAIERLHTMFDLRADPASIRSALTAVLPGRRTRVSLEGLRVPGAWDGFEVAIRTVVSRGVGKDATEPVMRALVERFGRPISADDPPGLSRLFPSPHALSRASLRRCGLPPRLAATVGRLARCVAQGRITLEPGVPFPQLVECLVTEAGLDRSSAEWIGMRTVGEPDADVTAWLGLPSRLRVWWENRRTQEALRPWRTYAALFLAGGSGPLTCRGRSTRSAVGAGSRAIPAAGR